MDLPLLEILFGAGATALIGIIGLVWKIVYESRAARHSAVEAEAEVKKVKAEAESIAVEAAHTAVQTVQAALEAQAAQVRDLSQRDLNRDTQMTRINQKLDDRERLYSLALGHIAEREQYAATIFEARPGDLPEIPVELRPDLEALDTNHRLHKHPRPRSPDPKARTPPERK
ncbi:hypothetical protein EAH68_12890 [Corynebacterium hylobatis]|uniref:Uncharacterized protein n=1 Tax=Corynebacterium hylobatis TaxID=1859290 RepID=A0A3R9ZYE0_9CORY|nr:hypothetical protein [Corynebacterium hylobatis]RSZ61552.1 hypothetical protein EAH68_12890 [Corynebacterium hylobatis]